MLKYLFILFLLVTAKPVISLAQTAESVTTVQATTEAGTSEVEMADTLRRDGKNLCGSSSNYYCFGWSDSVFNPTRS